MSRVRRLYPLGNQQAAQEPSIAVLRAKGVPVAGQPGVYRLYGQEYYSAALLDEWLAAQRG